MTSDIPALEIVALDRVDLMVERWAWPFAQSRREEIDRHFSALQRERPAVWNGRVLLLHRHDVEGGVLRGACFEADYASFLAWRAWQFPDRGVFNVFAAAALRAGDGAHIVVEMAPGTAAAGRIYFCSGTPDPADVRAGGILDLEGNLRRELLEETGIDIGTLAAEPGWKMIRDRGFLALVKVLAASEDAHALRERILHHLAGEAQPELCAVHIVRGPGDLVPGMSHYVVAYLEQVWGH